MMRAIYERWAHLQKTSKVLLDILKKFPNILSEKMRLMNEQKKLPQFGNWHRS